jgi:F-type H+-transporting ATPase subunit gamma
MDRASAASAYAERITALVGNLTRSGLPISHPLLLQPKQTKTAILLVLTANRGMCGGYNGSVLRASYARRAKLLEQVPDLRLEVSGKRGISAFRFRKIQPDEQFRHFEDKPRFEEVDLLATRYLKGFESGELDRLDVAYTKFESLGRQHAVVETLLPLGELEGVEQDEGQAAAESPYEFLPSAKAVLDEVVPTSFKAKLFKCFLDAAVSEQIARMVAMKAATENADSMISHLTMVYNRARQGQITSELLEVISGAEALTG